MAETEMKQKVVKGLLWKLLENGGAQGVQFVIAIILARLLTPAQYGVVGIITIFITIANVVVQSGFSTALVQKQKADKVDFSSVCYFDLFVALVMYGILYAAAPVIASFYGIAELEAREVELPDGYEPRMGHPINSGERVVMMPHHFGGWLDRFDVEHALQAAGIKFKTAGVEYE